MQNVENWFRPKTRDAELLKPYATAADDLANAQETVGEAELVAAVVNWASVFQKGSGAEINGLDHGHISDSGSAHWFA